MFEIYGFTTNDVQTPWTDADIAEFKSKGSRHDVVLYNQKLNARFILGTNDFGYSYSCSIKVADDKYRNFVIAPLTFNSFYIIIYIPQFAKACKVADYKLIDNILHKFPLLKAAIDSRRKSDKVELLQDCYIIDSFVWCKVNAPISQILYPKYDNIVNVDIIDAYKRLCLIYRQAKIQYDKLKEYVVKVCDAYTVKKKAQQKIERELEEKLSLMILRRVLLGGLAVITGGASLPFTAVCNVYSDVDDIFDAIDAYEAWNCCDLLDMSILDSVDCAMPEFADMSIWDYEIYEYNDLVPESVDDVTFKGNCESVDWKVENWKVEKEILESKKELLEEHSKFLSEQTKAINKTPNQYSDSYISCISNDAKQTNKDLIKISKRICELNALIK